MDHLLADLDRQIHLASQFLLELSLEDLAHQVGFLLLYYKDLKIAQQRYSSRNLKSKILVLIAILKSYMLWFVT